MRWMPPVSGSAGSTTGKSQLTMLVGHLSRNDSGSFAAKKSKVCSPLGQCWSRDITTAWYLHTHLVKVYIYKACGPLHRRHSKVMH